MLKTSHNTRLINIPHKASAKEAATSGLLHGYMQGFSTYDTSHTLKHKALECKNLKARSPLWNLQNRIHRLENGLEPELLRPLAQATETGPGHCPSKPGAAEALQGFGVGLCCLKF